MKINIVVPYYNLRDQFIYNIEYWMKISSDVNEIIVVDDQSDINFPQEIVIKIPNLKLVKTQHAKSIFNSYNQMDAINLGIQSFSNDDWTHIIVVDADDAPIALPEFIPPKTQTLFGSQYQKIINSECSFNIQIPFLSKLIVSNTCTSGQILSRNFINEYLDILNKRIFPSIWWDTRVNLLVSLNKTFEFDQSYKFVRLFHSANDSLNHSSYKRYSFNWFKKICPVILLRLYYHLIRSIV